MQNYAVRQMDSPKKWRAIGETDCGGRLVVSWETIRPCALNPQDSLIDTERGLRQATSSGGRGHGLIAPAKTLAF